MLGMPISDPLWPTPKVKRAIYWMKGFMGTAGNGLSVQLSVVDIILSELTCSRHSLLFARLSGNFQGQVEIFCSCVCLMITAHAERSEKGSH